MVDILDKREPEGDRTEKLSVSFLAGTAVRDELSEKMVEPLVAEDVLDFMLAPSKDRLGPFELSEVETESYIEWPSLLPVFPHCWYLAPLSPAVLEAIVTFAACGGGRGPVG